MPNTNKSAKGNPANVRMSNPRTETRRAECWARSQKRKEANRKANEERARSNDVLRDLGLLTPHEIKKAKRRAQRDALRAKGLLPPIGTTRQEWDKQKRAAA